MNISKALQKSCSLQYIIIFLKKSSITLKDSKHNQSKQFSLFGEIMFQEKCPFDEH